MANKLQRGTFDEMLKRCRSRGSKNEVEVENTETKTKPKKTGKLKPFPDEVACLPNEWVRSGLFTCSSRLKYLTNPVTGTKTRLHYEHFPVPSWSENVKIFYSGFELNQFDLKVWLTCIRKLKTSELGKSIILTPYQFCDAVGIKKGGESSRLCYDALDRLFKASIKSRTYQDGKILREYNNHLIDRFYLDEETGLWEISLNPEFETMFSKQTTWVNWDLWKNISSGVLQFLVFQVSAHKATPDNPQKMTLSKLKELMRNDQPDFQYRRLIKKMLLELRNLGLISEYDFSNDIVTFIREGD